MNKVPRLYQQFQPDNYQLKLTLDKPAMAFYGQLTISGKKSGRPSQRLTLHQKGLKITNASIVKHDKKGSQPINVSRVNNQNNAHEVRIHSDQLLYPGAYDLTLEFSGKITPGMTGLYPCYFTVDGQEHSLLATQFESHHARELFPCIDEPEAKATFDLTLTTEQNVTVLANTPQIDATQNDDGTVTTRFETTPRMSSYLLAFVAGRIHGKHGRTKLGTVVSAWATVAQPLDSLDHALDVATRSIEFFEDYFGVPYPLAKADHIALPDFSAGAMENWGLITYRERVLLAYPGDSSQSIRETIALVIAHETSHQWFGNLVTMKWWNDLWLNESFANMMEYQAVDSMFPEWQVWDTFVAQEGLSALRRDATPGVQAVKTAVNHPDEISTLFDPSIVYAKGGRLLYMLKNFIGDDAFRSGLSAYFTRHAYGNTEGADLWAALSDASGIDVAAFMNPWLERSGFPVITIEQTDATTTIKQQHFLDNLEKADTSRLWPVPTFASQPTVPKQFTEQAIDCSSDVNSLLRLNTDARGHYIVNYPSPLQRQQLVELIKDKTLSNAERLMILNNSSMLARAGLQPFGSVLDLLTAYQAESSEPVWDIISLIIGELRRFVDVDETLEPAIKRLVAKLIVVQHKRLGWDEAANDSAADQKLRALIIALGSYAEDSKLVNEALKRYKASRSKLAQLPSELRSIIYGVAVKQNLAGAVEELLSLHDATSNSDLKSDIAAALTGTRDLKVAARLLERIKNVKLVKPQDADRWLVYLMRNRYTRNIAWDWMETNWDWIESTYSNDKSYDYMPRYAAGGCNTDEWAVRYKKFFEPKQDQIVLKRNILIGIEEITNRVIWLQRDLTSVQKFLQAQ